MVLPLLGILGASIFAATEAGKAIAASNAPKPLSPESQSAVFDRERDRATRSAYSTGMHSLQSLARSGGSAASQATGLRAAMLAAPEVANQATQAGYSAGAQMGAAKTGRMQDARQAETQQSLGVADQWGRVGNSIGLGVNDLKNGLVAAQALGGPPGYQRAAGPISDERSKQRIQELEAQNAALSRQIGGMPAAPAASAPPAFNPAQARTALPQQPAPNPDQSGHVQDVDRMQLAQQYAQLMEEYRRLGLEPIDIDEMEGLDEEDGPVAPPPANDPKYDTYVPPATTPKKAALGGAKPKGKKKTDSAFWTQPMAAGWR